MSYGSYFMDTLLDFVWWRYLLDIIWWGYLLDIVWEYLLDIVWEYFYGYTGFQSLLDALITDFGNKF